jgi:uncharacterized membrane protein
MANTISYPEGGRDALRPGVELRWPASALWRDGEPVVRKISMRDVFDSLAHGIRDFIAVPTHAVFLCLIYPIAGFILYRAMFGYELVPYLYPMAAGFALLGPVAAIGLYELSRRLERGEKVSALDALAVLRGPSSGAILRLGLILTLIFFAWIWIAGVIQTQILGDAAPASIGAFVERVTTTSEGRQLIIVGNLIGFLFAALVLVIANVSFPMMVDRDVGAATAVRTSIRAAVENPGPIALWGLIVAAGLSLGALPLFAGLILVLPVLGHATWHLYRKLVA